jgi:hypothetical protein
MNDEQHVRFEELLDEVLGERTRGNDVCAVELWSALAGTVWQGPRTEQVRYSMRSAGEVVAQIRKEGEYTDWYMSGPTCQVADWIAADLARHGWTWMPA